jgi:predicted transcriptional regulator
MQPSELGERLQIARPTVTSLVNALEARGFVRRRQLVEEGRCMFEEHMRRLVEFLGAEDARELIRLIRRVQQFSEMRKPKCGN